MTNFAFFILIFKNIALKKGVDQGKYFRKLICQNIYTGNLLAVHKFYSENIYKVT